MSTSLALPGSDQKQKCVDDPQRTRAIAAVTPPKRISKNGAAVGKHPKQIANADGKSPKHTSTPRRSRKPGE